MESKANTVSDTFGGVLRDEIGRLRPSAHDPQQSPEACADRAQLIGLAFSGGGIRSATFCLGIIQALARLRLLRAFDYLSTVSGGGYIGGWLSTLIFRSRSPDQPLADALAAVEHALSGEARPWCRDGTPASDCPAEHPSLRFLRRYSNYLTPRLGIFSGDSLSAASTYLRNLLLNQFILVAFFGALLTLPYLLLSLGHWLVDPEAPMLAAPLGRTGLSWILGLAIAPLLVAVAACAMSLTRFHKFERVNTTGPAFAVYWIVAPSLISAWLFSLALLVHEATDEHGLWDWVKWTMLGYLLPWVAAFWARSGGFGVVMKALEKLPALRVARGDAGHARDAWDELRGLGVNIARFAWQIPWTLLAGALGGAIFYALREASGILPETGRMAYATAFGTPLLLMGYSLVVALHIGLMKRLNTEQAREWWSRLGGFILLAALAWLGAFAVTLYAAPLLQWLTVLALAGGLAWAASSIGGVLLGKSALTGGGNRPGSARSVLNLVALAAPYVFVVGLTILLAGALHALLTRPVWPCETCVPNTGAADFGLILQSALFNLARVDWTDALGVGAVCAAVFGLLGWRVDINLFSLHGFYRNRLTRCFLGATRVGPTRPVRIVRKPHPFTGFDFGDDLPLAVLLNQRPYPIVNAAMNLTGGEDLAWQTRRAASFTFTPQHTGFEFWSSEGNCVGAYRPTEEYAVNQFEFLNLPGGIELGDVMATSGAAANPNMGYHSSPALSALMSVFNVRLGRWCGNPCHADAWREASPRFGGFSLLNEVFGTLHSRSRFLNISDGGHFENLGIYELVRRRCHVVVSVDAGCDPGFAFEDLANAIRKCWTDFGTRIEIDLSALRPRGKPGRSAAHCAVGRIRYPNGQPGILVYIKASLSGDESSDVKEYADRHPKFPNESTGDQFFDENQFESYRELGRHIGLEVFARLTGAPHAQTGDTPAGQTRERLIEKLSAQLQQAVKKTPLRQGYRVRRRPGRPWGIRATYPDG